MLSTHCTPIIEESHPQCITSAESLITSQFIIQGLLGDIIKKADIKISRISPAHRDQQQLMPMPNTNEKSLDNNKPTMDMLHPYHVPPTNLIPSESTLMEEANVKNIVTSTEPKAKYLRKDAT